MKILFGIILGFLVTSWFFINHIGGFLDHMKTEGFIIIDNVEYTVMEKTYD